MPACCAGLVYNADVMLHHAAWHALSIDGRLRVIISYNFVAACVENQHPGDVSSGVEALVSTFHTGSAA